MGAIHRAGENKSLMNVFRSEINKENVIPVKPLLQRQVTFPAQYVIHTVGPVWNGDKERCERLLGNCYNNALELAGNLGLKQLFFPNISTGIYKFPKDLAAEIAIKIAQNLESETIEKIIFVCFDEENERIYKAIAKIDWVLERTP